MSSIVWPDLPAAQQPVWPDQVALESVLAELRSQPPLVFAGECDTLTEQVGQAALGRAFVLTGGDCAETFAANTADSIRARLKTVLQMSIVLTYAASLPVVKMGRVAGQYFKPRSKATEVRDGVELPSYLGDAVNAIAFDAKSRRPDPERMLKAYHASGSALNLIRAFTQGGYADLRQVHAWNQDFVRDSPAGQLYDRLATDIDRAISFMHACGADPEEFKRVDFYAAHEALSLDYERSLTRIDSRTGLAYDVSGHFLWVGERTRQLDGAHVHFASTIRNPIGLKVGPTASPDEILEVVERLDPDRVPGRLSLITRMGATKVRDVLPVLRNTLKTSLLSAADVKSNPLAIALLGPLARLVNRFGGDFRWQHLPVPFEVYADGIDLVVFEEFGSGAAALHLRDEVERDALLQDEGYRRRFRKDYDAKFGMRVWHRDFFDAEIVECPDESVIGKSFGQVGIERGGLHPVDAFLDLVVEHGRKLRWRTTISNHRPEVLKKLARDEGIQMGFSDAGAHLRNMAFYNFGLRLLRHVRDAELRGEPFLSVERAVHRLTGELADWYDIDAGHLRIGDRADLVVVNPQRLDARLEEYAESPVPQYANLPRMVNRNDEAVDLVLIGGRAVVRHGCPTEVLGVEKTGSFLRAGQRTEVPAYAG